MSDVQVGQPGYYVDSRGRQKAAVVLYTHDSVDTEGQIIQPQVGHVHIRIDTLINGFEYRSDIPLREVAETIPDYTVEGKLVQYFQSV